jgi:A/G-specific adenine glycosylase
MMRKLLADRASDAAVRSAHRRRRLLLWYRRHGRKLPWREASDPYRIWVSEVMLQQTQVSTAIPFYQTFIGRFPTIMKLASAREPDVLALWSGLGYYARARRLLEAARMVARDHGGRVPNDPEIFGSLPGVGRYTTGAVLSIAFDRPLPVVDGNVARVLSRWYALPATVRDPKGAHELWRLATDLVPMQAPGQWNQALMELGALVCVSGTPACGVCPVRAHCMARRSGRVAEFPPPRPRRDVVRLRRAAVVVRDRGRVLMVRCTGSQLHGLWEPPAVRLASGASASAALRLELARLGVEARLERTAHRVRHHITCHAITVEVWRGELVGPRARPHASAAAAFVDARRPGRPLTGLARKLVGLTVGA